MPLTEKEGDAGLFAAISMVIGSLLYGLRLLMADNPLPRRQAFASVGVAGILSACGQTIAHEAVRATYPMSVAVGLLVGFLGGGFWIVQLERLARRKANDIAGSSGDRGAS